MCHQRLQGKFDTMDVSLRSIRAPSSISGWDPRLHHRKRTLYLYLYLDLYSTCTRRDTGEPCGIVFLSLALPSSQQPFPTTCWCPFRLGRLLRTNWDHWSYIDLHGSHTSYQQSRATTKWQVSSDWPVLYDICVTFRWMVTGATYLALSPKQVKDCGCQGSRVASGWRW